MTHIDSHLHYWWLARGDYGWLTPKETALYRDFTPTDVAPALKRADVNGVVLIQAAPSEAETLFLLGVAQCHTPVAAVVGWMDFEAPDIRERLQTLIRAGAGKLRGLRPMVQDIEDSDWLARESLDEAFDALIDNQLTFDALVRPMHLRLLGERLRKHPRLKAVLDHAGKPHIAGRSFDAWARLIAELAGTTSLYCKLSGLLTEARPGADAADLDPYVAHLFKCFGADRIMWGSDWPMLSAAGSYHAWLMMALALVKRHAPGAESAVFRENAARFYALSNNVSQDLR